MSEVDTSQYTDGQLVEFVAAHTHARYKKWVDLEDIRQELWTYQLGEGGKYFKRWHEKGQHYRVKLALFGAAKQYCEAEKAARSGYSFDDIAWYAPENLAWLVELAFDPQFDGHIQAEHERTGGKKSTGPEGGTILAMVADVRRVLDNQMKDYRLEDFDEWAPEAEGNLRKLADWLGGEFPNSPGYQRGRRRVVSNAQARAYLGLNEVQVRRKVGWETAGQ